jgi:Ulp1 family protease
MVTSSNASNVEVPSFDLTCSELYDRVFDATKSNLDENEISDSENETSFLDDEFRFELGLSDPEEDDVHAEDADDPPLQADNDTQSNSSDMITGDSSEQNSWEIISDAEDDAIICSSSSEREQLTKSDIKRLLNRNWINDQIINFFSDSVNQHTSGESMIQIKTHLCNTWLFWRLSTTSEHGEIGRYNFSSVRRHFRIECTKTWQIETFCVPIHIQRSHWLCCVIKVPERTLLVIDSLPEFAPEVSRKRIGDYCRKWYTDELKAALKQITAADCPYYVGNPIERETLVREKNIQIHNTGTAKD